MEPKLGKFSKFMIFFGFAFAIAFIYFLDYCPLAVHVKPYVGM